MTRWPYSAAATFVGVMWVMYAWAIWAAGGIDRHMGGVWMGALTNDGYEITGALRPYQVTQEGEWERLVSSIFLHIGFVHILFNSAAIMQLGTVLERFTTRGRCFFTLLLSGLCGSLTTVIWGHITGDLVRGGAGASGAACGLGAALIVISRGVLPLVEFRKQIITWVAVALLMGLAPMISGTGHLGGVIGGMLAGWALKRRGSVHMSRDSWTRGLQVATALLTLFVVAGLVVNALHAPRRKAAIVSRDAIVGALNEVDDWCHEGVPADVAVWVERVSELDLVGEDDATRRALLDLVRPLVPHAGENLTWPQIARVQSGLRRLERGP